MKVLMNRFISLLMLCAMMIAVSTADAQYSLTILHNNDGESKLRPPGTNPNYAGAARFVTKVNELKAAAATDGLIMVSSGDNFLAGAEFNASLNDGVFYDALVLDKIGYDAISFGNHDFDFGPSLLADFMDDFPGPNYPPYLCANADFSAEPDLQAKVVAGRIVSRTVINTGGVDVGIVGAIYPDLALISSPGNVIVDQNVVDAVQTEVNALDLAGVDIIILISHLQDVTADVALIAQLTNIDAAVAGGGDNFLANAGISPVFPGDVPNPAYPYPLMVQDANTNNVPVVTTTGEYRYVGRLVLNFDANGDVLSVDPISNPVCVLDASIDPVNGVVADVATQADVIDHVNAYVSGLAANVIATSDVALDGRRATVRTLEANEGNLFADALLWEGQRKAAAFGMPTPQVAIQNGGGMRKDAIIPAGNITELNTYEIAAFANVTCIVPEIPRAQFKEILERLCSQYPVQNGCFGQIAGFSYCFDPAFTAQVLDNQANTLVPGERVRECKLDNGSYIVKCGEVVPGSPITIATIDFSAAGGDNYPFRGAEFTRIGVTYQQALYNYLTETTGLNGFVSAVDYPSGGEGRISNNGCEEICCDLNIDGLSNIGNSFCMELCPDISSRIRISGLPTNGFPVLTKRIGCSVNCNNPGCTPTTYITEIFGSLENNDWMYNAESGIFWLEIRGDGCICVTLDAVLPVELIGFEAVPDDAQVRLSWSTASEHDVQSFEVFRNGSKVSEVGAYNNAAGHSYNWTDGGLRNGTTYTYTLFAMNVDGSREELATAEATPAANAATITEYTLYQNYPNPFNPETSISFDLIEDRNVTLTVFNPLGQTVATLVNGELNAGRHTVRFDGGGFTSGLYFYRLEAGDFSAMRKMILIK